MLPCIESIKCNIFNVYCESCFSYPWQNSWLFSVNGSLPEIQLHRFRLITSLIRMKHLWKSVIKYCFTKNSNLKHETISGALNKNSIHETKMRFLENEIKKLQLFIFQINWLKLCILDMREVSLLMLILCALQLLFQSNKNIIVSDTLGQVYSIFFAAIINKREDLSNSVQMVLIPCPDVVPVSNIF